MISEEQLILEYVIVSLNPHQNQRWSCGAGFKMMVWIPLNMHLIMDILKKWIHLQKQVPIHAMETQPTT